MGETVDDNDYGDVHVYESVVVAVVVLEVAFALGLGVGFADFSFASSGCAVSVRCAVSGPCV
jgi:hypothetical protein